MLFTIVAIIAFFADIGTDLKVAADHFAKGNNFWWGSFTLLLVFLPSAVTNLVSFLWYKEDAELGRPPKSGWRAVCLTHLLLVGLVERWVAFKTSQQLLLRLFSAEKMGSHCTRHATHYVTRTSKVACFVLCQGRHGRVESSCCCCCYF